MSKQCITFHKYAHNQKLVSPITISDWLLDSTSFTQPPDKSFRFYDPALDGGPKNAIGVEVAGDFVFTPFPGKRTYDSVTISYVSNYPAASIVRLTDPQAYEVGSGTMHHAPQQTLLKATFKAPSFSAINIRGMELIVVQICVKYTD